MPIFARLIKRISRLKNCFQVPKISASKMANISMEAYEALLVFEAQVPDPVDLSLYRAETKEAA